MKTLDATTQLGVLNQRLLMIKYNNCFPYSGPHRHEDDYLGTFFSSVKSNDRNNADEIIVGTKTLLIDAYSIVYKSGLNIAKFLQDHFYQCVIPINIWSDNTQGEFMGSVH